MTAQNFTAKPLTRRTVFLLTAATGLWACAPKGAPAEAQGTATTLAEPQRANWEVLPALSALEARAGGRLGVAILDLHTGRRAGYRAEERFALCSTFKMALVGLVLREADRGRLDLSERLLFTAAYVERLRARALFGDPRDRGRGGDRVGDRRGD